MRSFRVLFPIVLLAFGLSPAGAQFANRYGIKVGAAISNIRVSDAAPLTVPGQAFFLELIDGYVVNPSITLFVNALQSEGFVGQIDLTYLRKGASKSAEYLVTTPQNPDGDGTKASITTEIGLHYLELKMLAQPRLPLGNAVAYVNVGPSLGYLLSMTSLATIGDQPKQVQAGYNLGLGLGLVRSDGNELFIEVSYAGDFSPFYEHNYGKFRNRTWAVSVGTTL